MHYRATVRLVDGFTTGFEAVVRWRHPERGLVPPFAFIPLAEETGAIAEGVETREQAEALTSLGCPLVQGFRYARPQPASELRPAALTAVPGPRGSDDARPVVASSL